MIESIRIQNYKALRDVTLHLTPIHVLIGKNDSGKTSILEAITALCRSVDYPLNEAFSGNWKSFELVWRRNSQLPVQFECQVRSPRVEAAILYHLECDFFDNRICVVKSESLGRQGSEYELLGDRNAESTFVYRFATFKTWIEGNNSRQNLVELHEALSQARTYYWSPPLPARPVPIPREPRREMDSSGYGLALVLHEIEKTSSENYREIVERLKSYFPDVTAVNIVQNENCELRFSFRNGMTSVEASQVSYGMLIILCYLAILYSKLVPRMLLFEEPENGIHPERLSEVISLIREIGAKHPRTQVILTTHSPYLVSDFAPEEVTLCHKEPDGSVSLHRLSASEAVKRQSSIFTLGEIWTGEGDDDLARSTTTTENTAP